jgi:hypothetical protein
VQEIKTLGGAMKSFYEEIFFILILNSMQRVSECELVIFCGPPPAFGGRRAHAEAAASP